MSNETPDNTGMLVCKYHGTTVAQDIGALR
jgi:hypothetical protein